MTTRMNARAAVMTGTVLLLLAAVAAYAGASRPNGSPQVDVPRISIEATGRGFVPDTVRLVAGAPADLVFTRTTSSSCVAQVHIPDLGVDRTTLPQGEAVVVRVTPDEPGSFEFRCGMDMHRGLIIVAPSGNRVRASR
jgi:P-type Cu+ transporter